METVIIGDNVTSLKTSVTGSNWNNLRSLTLGKNVTMIQSGALANTLNLTEITYNSTIENFKKINLVAGWNGTHGCVEVIHCTNGDYIVPYLCKLTLDDGKKIVHRSSQTEYEHIIRSLDFFSTSYRNNCVKIEIGDLCTEIQSSTFSGFTKVEELILSDTVKIIGGGCFTSCNIKSLTIPSNVTTLGGGVFMGNRIKSLTINSDTLVKNGGFSSNFPYTIEEVIIGDGVTEIGTSAFNSFSNIISIVIPDSVTAIRA